MQAEELVECMERSTRAICETISAIDQQDRGIVVPRTVCRYEVDLAAAAAALDVLLPEDVNISSGRPTLLSR
jgi:hypothetical protein